MLTEDGCTDGPVSQITRPITKEMSPNHKAIYRPPALQIRNQGEQTQPVTQ